MAIEEREFPSVSEAAMALAKELASALQQAVLRRGSALLALSGGHTPGLVFEALCALEVDWGRVTMTLTDERWLPPDHPDSNEQLVRAHFPLGAAGSARFVPL
jgi:6-phosphogluconolactonase